MTAIMSPPILQTAHHHYPHLPSQPTTPHRSSQSLASSTQTPPNTEPSTSISPAEAALLPSMRRTKQLRPPRCTNYVPAVLRRTEWPSSGTATAAPSTGTAILASNLLTPPDSASVSLSGSLDDPKMLRTAKRHQSDVTPTKPDLLDEQRIFEEEWLNAEDEKGRPVVNEPTRLHWRPNLLSPFCAYAPCNRPFTFTVRRHHCRRCGLVFCSQHSSAQIPLDQDARLHPAGRLSRACLPCDRDFVLWDRLRRETVAGVGLGAGGRLLGMRGHRRGGGEGIGAKPVGIGGGSARRSRAGVGMEEEVDEYGVLDGVDAEGEDGELRTEDGAGTEGRAAKRQSGVGGWVKGTRAAISESIGRDWNWSTF